MKTLKIILFWVMVLAICILFWKFMLGLFYKPLDKIEGNNTVFELNGQSRLSLKDSQVHGDIIINLEKDLQKKQGDQLAPLGQTEYGKPVITSGALLGAANALLIESAIDPLWKTGKIKRKQVYNWLRQKFGYEIHVGSTDIDTCKKIIEVVKNENS